MNERLWGGWGAIAGLALLGAMGGGPNFAAMSLDEVEAWWVQSRIRARRKLEQDAVRAIAGLAKATGPAAQHFGYCRHAATKSKPKSDSLKRLLGKDKRGPYRRAA